MPPLGVALAVSAVLGAIGGSAFHWAGGRAWDVFIAAFLWTLIAAAGTALGCYVGERLVRGAWRRGAWIAGLLTFPLTTVYSLVAFSFSATAESQRRPDAVAVLPVFYLATLVVAIFLGLSWILTSPFRHK